MGEVIGDAVAPGDFRHFGVEENDPAGLAPVLQDRDASGDPSEELLGGGIVRDNDGVGIHGGSRVERMGFEPTTPWLQTRCSPN